MAKPIVRPASFKDITGERFHRVIVLSLSHCNRSGTAYWSCRCDCGETFVASGQRLRNGETKSCGCYRRDRIGSLRRRHGMSRSDEYRAWVNIKMRCYNSNNSEYGNYGGRGIAVCERWRDSFENFLADMGPRPSHRHSIDRYPDVDGDYGPGNCRWATPSQQASNKRTSRLLTVRGVTKTLTAWAAELGIAAEAIKSRPRSGWSVERACTTKSGRRRAFEPFTFCG